MSRRASLLAAAAVLLLAAAMLAARLWPQQLLALANDSAVIAQQLGAAGWLLAFLVQVVVAMCGVLPASVGAVACGVAYGIVGGFVLSASGTLVAAQLAFLLSRSLLRPLIVRLLATHPRAARLEAGVVRDGWRLVALLRCSPVMPFAVTSYAFGLTSISLRAYLIGSLAALPALLGYVILGGLSADGLASIASPRERTVHLALLGLAIVATGLLTWRAGRIVQVAVQGK
jgi:uncharacterized membrane protein YdjX (TVP38/TMEM64 family)